MRYFLYAAAVLIVSYFYSVFEIGRKFNNKNVIVAKVWGDNIGSGIAIIVTYGLISAAVFGYFRNGHCSENAPNCCGATTTT